MLPKGEYRGELYDIGFDRPEAHAIAKDGAMYYTFYADDFSGTVELRGLPAGRYRVRDLFNAVDLGEVDGNGAKLRVAFKRFVLLQATPVEARA
jgi:alpha-galactosidase